MRITFTRCIMAILGSALTLHAIPGRAQQAGPCKLAIHVDGFRNDKGDLGISIFKSSDGWPEHNDKSFLHGPFPFSGDKTTVTVQVPPGRYSIVALHDENSNHKLDRNFLGFPKEGFGFSNNPKVNLLAPSFETAAIQVACPSTETTIHLIYK